VRNLRILGVDKDENLLVVKAVYPGQRGYLVIMRAKKPPRERVDSRVRYG